MFGNSVLPERLNAFTSGGGEARPQRVYNYKFIIIIIALVGWAPSLHIFWSFQTVSIGGVNTCVPMIDVMDFYFILK